MRRAASASGAAPRKAEEQRKVNVHSANTVTKDFLLLSQPFINQGILIASASSGRWSSLPGHRRRGVPTRAPALACRRIFIHHLSEIPLSEVFLTRTGNHLQRVDKQTVKLAGSIAIEVPPAPSVVVPSASLAAQIPTAVFSGPISGRDEKVQSGRG